MMLKTFVSLLVLLGTAFHIHAVPTITCNDDGTVTLGNIGSDSWFHINDCPYEEITSATQTSTCTTIIWDVPFFVFVNVNDNIELVTDFKGSHTCVRLTGTIVVSNDITIGMQTGSATDSTSNVQPFGTLVIQDSTTDAGITTAWVGQSIQARIELDSQFDSSTRTGGDGFIFKVLDCNIVNLGDATGTEIDLTDDDGCDADGTPLGVVRSTEANDPRVVHLTFAAFKVRGQNNGAEVHRITCNLKICTIANIADCNPSACTGSNNNRRRRQAENEDDDVISVEGSVKIYSTQEAAEREAIIEEEERILQEKTLCMNKRGLLSAIGVLAAGLILSIIAACWIFIASRKSRRRHDDEKTIYMDGTSFTSGQMNRSFRQ